MGFRKDTRMEKKTILIIIGAIFLLVLAVWFGLDILKPALDPVIRDMIKIFFCGLGCGVLTGIWVGIKIGRAVAREEQRHGEEIG